MEPLDDHSICLDRFRDISADIVSLRAENCRLRSANAKLLKILAKIGGGLPLNRGRPSATEVYNRRHCESKRGPSPESVSVKSRMASGRSVGHAGELELYDQGSFKTELCNKWEATGSCPYGGRCRFAHGIAELRPVPRDHRFKTEVCRVVRAGRKCPFGRQCHFRHTPPPRR